MLTCWTSTWHGQTSEDCNRIRISGHPQLFWHYTSHRNEWKGLHEKARRSWRSLTSSFATNSTFSSPVCDLKYNLVVRGCATTTGSKILLQQISIGVYRCSHLITNVRNAVDDLGPAVTHGSIFLGIFDCHARPFWRNRHCINFTCTSLILITFNEIWTEDCWKFSPTM